MHQIRFENHATLNKHFSDFLGLPQSIGVMFIVVVISLFRSATSCHAIATTMKMNCETNNLMVSKERVAPIYRNLHQSLDNTCYLLLVSGGVMSTMLVENQVDDELASSQKYSRLRGSTNYDGRILSPLP